MFFFLLLLHVLRLLFCRFNIILFIWHRILALYLIKTLNNPRSFIVYTTTNALKDLLFTCISYGFYLSENKLGIIN